MKGLKRSVWTLVGDNSIPPQLIPAPIYTMRMQTKDLQFSKLGAMFSGVLRWAFNHVGDMRIHRAEQGSNTGPCQSCYWRPLCTPIAPTGGDVSLAFPGHLSNGCLNAVIDLSVCEGFPRRIFISASLCIFRDALSEGWDFYRGYIKGYEEGLNRAWDELIGLTTRGYSSREVQVMAKSKRQSISPMVYKRKVQIREESGVDLISKPVTVTSTVTPGKGYLIESVGLSKAVNVFNNLLAAGSEGLIISRRYPGDLEERLRGTPDMYWLTRQEMVRDGSYPCLSPSDPGRISSVTSKFMKDGPGRVVMFEGTDYMIIQSGDFPQVAKFLHALVDQAISSNGILLIPINPAVLEERQLRLLENMAYVIST